MTAFLLTKTYPLVTTFFQGRDLGSPETGIKLELVDRQRNSGFPYKHPFQQFAS